MEEMIKSLMLTLACLSSVGTPKSLLTLTKAKPSYQVINSEGILGEHSPKGLNTIQMDCTGCFPEGKLISMKIRDITGNCRNLADTSHSKNKNVATIYCRPCDNYDLEVSAKVVIEGVTECVNRVFKYRKDACPSNAADVTASPQVSREKTFESRSSNIGNSLNKTENMSGSRGSSLSKEEDGGGLEKESNSRSSGNHVHFSATIFTLLSANLPFMLSLFN